MLKRVLIIFVALVIALFFSSNLFVSAGFGNFIKGFFNNQDVSLSPPVDVPGVSAVAVNPVNGEIYVARDCGVIYKINQNNPNQPYSYFVGGASISGGGNVNFAGNPPNACLGGYVDSSNPQDVRFGTSSSTFSFSNMVVSPNGQTLYVGDLGNHVVRAVNTQTGATTTLSSPSGSGASYVMPGWFSIDVDSSGNVYSVTNSQATGSHMIKKFDGSSWNNIFTVTSQQYGGNIGSIAVTPDGLKAYLSFGSSIVLLTFANGQITPIATLPNEPSQMIFKNGKIYTLAVSSIAWEIDVNSGTYSLIAGSTPGFSDGTPGQLNYPKGIARLPDNTILVADHVNSRVRKIVFDPFSSQWILSTLGNTCGNGVVESSEQCDDGNFIDFDGCTHTCTLPTCGDNVISYAQPPSVAEVCEPNLFSDGYCSSDCRRLCGDGTVQSGELCDDGNNNNGDGCNALCNVESSCSGGIQCSSGSICSNLGFCQVSSCGNGQNEPGEYCDFTTYNQQANPNSPVASCNNKGCCNSDCSVVTNSDLVVSAFESGSTFGGVDIYLLSDSYYGHAWTLGQPGTPPVDTHLLKRITLVDGQSILPSSVAVVDVNNDGQDDVLIGESSKNRIIGVNGLDGKFFANPAGQAIAIQGFPGSGFGKEIISVGDPDLDGKDNFIVVDVNGFVSYWTISDVFPYIPQLTLTLSPPSPALQSGFGKSIAVGNLFGTAIPELVVGAPNENGGAGGIYIYEIGNSQPAHLTLAQIEGITSSQVNDKKGFGSSMTIVDGKLYVGAPGPSTSVPVMNYPSFTLGSGYQPYSLSSFESVAGTVYALSFGSTVTGASSITGTGSGLPTLEWELFDTQGFVSNPLDFSYSWNCLGQCTAFFLTNQGILDTVRSSRMFHSEFGTSIIQIEDQTGDGIKDLVVSAPKFGRNHRSFSTTSQEAAAGGHPTGLPYATFVAFQNTNRDEGALFLINSVNGEVIEEADLEIQNLFASVFPEPPQSAFYYTNAYGYFSGYLGPGSNTKFGTKIAPLPEFGGYPLASLSSTPTVIGSTEAYLSSAAATGSGAPPSYGPVYSSVSGYSLRAFPFVSITGIDQVGVVGAQVSINKIIDLEAST